MLFPTIRIGYVFLGKICVRLWRRDAALGSAAADLQNFRTEEDSCTSECFLRSDLRADPPQEQVSRAQENHNAQDFAGGIEEKHDAWAPAFGRPTIQSGHVPDGDVRQGRKCVVLRRGSTAANGLKNESGESPIGNA